MTERTERPDRAIALEHVAELRATLHTEPRRRRLLEELQEIVDRLRR
ncbi:MAG: hypothetical protein AB7H43_14520 [Acidimicrobiia bacterium]